MATVEVAKPHYTWLSSSDQSRNNRKPLAPATLPGHKRPILSLALPPPRIEPKLRLVWKEFVRRREVTSPLSYHHFLKTRFKFA